MVDTRKQARPWPTGAEWARSDAVNAAKEAAQLLRSALNRLACAREQLASNPQLAELLMADASREVAEAMAWQQTIQLVLEAVKRGT